MKQAVAVLFIAAWANAAFAQGLAKESVTLATSDAVAISGYFVRGTSGKGPAVVLLHMLNGGKEDWEPIIEKYLRPQTGFSFLAIDLRGHGESLRQGEKVLQRKDFGEKDFNNMTMDVEAAVKWLKGRGDVDADKIAILGASIGANLALVYAAQDTTMKAVALLSPALNYKGVKTGEAIKVYGKRPVFLAAGLEDLASSSAVTILGKSALGDETTRVFNGNLHGTRMFAAYPVDKLLAQFLNAYLK